MEKEKISQITIVLWTEKVDVVKEQLANIHLEVIMFMSKIKKLFVHDNNEDSALRRVNAICVSREKTFRTTKNEHSQSFIHHNLKKKIEITYEDIHFNFHGIETLKMSYWDGENFIRSRHLFLPPHRILE